MAKQKYNNKLFKERLTLLMKEQELNAAQLANKLGISRQAVANYLTGDSIPNAIICSEIANLFDISIDYLVGRSGQRTVLGETTFQYFGLTDKTIQYLKKLRDESRCTEDAAYLLYLLNLIICEENYEKEEGLLHSIANFIFNSSQGRNENVKIFNKEMLSTMENSAIFQMDFRAKLFKEKYNNDYSTIEDEFIYSYISEPDEDGFYYLDNYDCYFKEGQYYYTDGDSFYPCEKPNKRSDED